LSRALTGVEVRALDRRLAELSGELLAEDGDEIVTSDPNDLRDLLRATGRHVELISA
jgi:hypothetical protein